MKSGIVLLVLLLLLAFVLGAVLFSPGPSPHYQAATEALRLNTAGKMAILKVVFWYGLAGIVLLSLVGLSFAFLRLLWRRSKLIRPEASGIFPVVRDRAAGQIYYHDPNRQLAGSVAYRAGDEGVEAQHLLPAGSEAEQLQVTTQAQAAQVVAAAGQPSSRGSARGGRGMSPTARRLVEQMTQPRTVPGMPHITVLNETIPEERRLLAAIRAQVEGDEGGG